MHAHSLAPVLVSIAAVGAALAAASTATTAWAAPVEQKAEVRRFALSTGMADGKMVFLDAQGKPVTSLRVNQGDTVELTLSSGEGAEHDFAIPELSVQSRHFSAETATPST